MSVQTVQGILNKRSRNLHVYYDGACHLCAREINHYREKPGAENIEFVDISDPQFDAVAVGMEPGAVQKFFHVKTPSGEIVTGVEAFAQIWDRLPSFHWLARFIRLPGVNLLARGGYRVFAEIRPLLPKRNCSTGGCQLP